MSLSSSVYKKCYRPLCLSARTYCEKSIYQRLEEGEKPKMVHGKVYDDWRQQWIKRDGEFKSKLNIFVEKNPNPNFMYALSQIPNFNLSMAKNWWADMKELQEVENQRYMQQRVATLGSNLAAVHFYTYRRAAVRLKGSKIWIKGDATTLNLPDSYEDGWHIEAVDCTDFLYNGVRYEGLQNLKNLSYLKWLCLKNSKHIDVWCIDRIAGQNGKTLEYLDISGCNLCIGSIMAIRRMDALRLLVVNEPGDNIPVQVALSMLEEEKPNLLIKTIDP